MSVDKANTGTVIDEVTQDDIGRHQKRAGILNPIVNAASVIFASAVFGGGAAVGIVNGIDMYHDVSFYKDSSGTLMQEVSNDVIALDNAKTFNVTANYGFVMDESLPLSGVPRFRHIEDLSQYQLPSSFVNDSRAKLVAHDVVCVLDEQGNPELIAGGSAVPATDVVAGDDFCSAVMASSGGVYDIHDAKIVSSIEASSMVGRVIHYRAP